MLGLLVMVMVSDSGARWELEVVGAGCCLGIYLLPCGGRCLRPLLVGWTRVAAIFVYTVRGRLERGRRSVALT